MGAIDNRKVWPLDNAFSRSQDPSASTKLISVGCQEYINSYTTGNPNFFHCGGLKLSPTDVVLRPPSRQGSPSPTHTGIVSFYFDTRPSSYANYKGSTYQHQELSALEDLKKGLSNPNSPLPV